MGLFSKEKKKAVQPIEYYLEQKSAKTLLNAGKQAMKVSIYVDKSKDNHSDIKCIYPQYGTEIFARDSLNESGTEKIPFKLWYSLSAETLYCWDVFRIAANKGSGEAALYLAVGYENGLKNLEKNQTEANKYYNMTTVIEPALQPLIDIINMTKNNMWFRRDFSEDQNVTLAMNLWMNNIEGSKYYSEVVKLDSRLRNIYLFISSYLLWAYADLSSIDDVWAIGMLSNALISYNNYANEKQIYKFDVEFKGKDLGLEMEKTVPNAGKIMRYEVWQKAQIYEKAANFCRQFDIYY